MIDLHAEFWSAIQALRPGDKERAGLGAWFDVGIAGVRFTSDGYEPDPGGRGAIIFGVFDGPDPMWSELYDLVAWQPTDNRLAARLGLAVCLGSIDQTLRRGEPIELYRSPRTWRGDWDGAVIVDWGRAAPQLIDARARLIVEDYAHGIEVDTHLAAVQAKLTPRRPPIRMRA